MDGNVVTDNTEKAPTKDNEKNTPLYQTSIAANLAIAIIAIFIVFNGSRVGC
jgi:hypothetical protein